jgi:RNA polymerase sigma factor (sigma-70 family)
VETTDWHDWLEGLVQGDEQIVAEFWAAYGERLQHLAASRIAPGLQHRVGPDDVVQSVCRTFFRRARAGEFDVADSASLWRLLCAITLTKTREQVRFHLRDKRSVRREQAPAVGDESRGPTWQLAADQPTPQQVAAFAEELLRLMQSLNAEEQQLVELKLEQATNQEIARRMGCSERTVRRILKRVQARLRQMLDESRLQMPE